VAKKSKIRSNFSNSIASKKLKSNLTMENFTILRSMLKKNLQENVKKEFVQPPGTIQIDDVNVEEGINRINNLTQNLCDSIVNNGSAVLKIPSRSNTNIIYDQTLDLLLLGNKLTSKNLLSLTSVIDTTRLMRVLELVYDGDVNLFQDQKNSDASIEDVSTILKTTRNSTHIVASAKGTAIGRLRIKDKNDIIDLEGLGSGGWTISPMLDNIEILESDAEFILVLEKDAAMIRISEARWWRKYPCIILTGKGAADMATRMFLKRINKVLNLPTFALMDSDPYGHYIYSVYLRGSKRLSYESPFLATPNMRLLGVLSKDLAEYNIPDNCRIPMNKQDNKRLDEMLNEEFVKNNKPWYDDLRLMKKLKVKAEIQALSAHGFEFLTESYLPNKIESGDWI